MTGLRRLGKIAKPISKDNTVTDSYISNSYFMENCFARSHYLQNYKYPVYIKKLLSSNDR